MVQNYGADARGLLMIDRSGRYSLQIFRADRPHFMSRDKYKGTAQEYAAATTGISTHVGLVELKPAEGQVVFRIESASFPNWEGTVQRRRYKLAGDILSYEVPPAADGTIAQSVWRRAD